MRYLIIVNLTSIFPEFSFCGEIRPYLILASLYLIRFLMYFNCWNFDNFNHFTIVSSAVAEKKYLHYFVAFLEAKQTPVRQLLQETLCPYFQYETKPKMKRICLFLYF
jgi:hypothetical protein